MRCATWLVLLFVLLVSAEVSAEIIEFRLTGNGGSGLLQGNVSPPSGSTGSGGIGATGITFDTMTNILHVHVVWGSLNGYSDLTGDVMMLHLHGPTPDGPPISFGQTGPLIDNLAMSPSFVASGMGGGVNDNFFISNPDVPGLLGGRTYINVHTMDFPMGEIRGYLITVPEPASSGLALLAAAWGTIGRRRCRAARA